VTTKEIERALEEVYKEMKSWRRTNSQSDYRISEDEVKRRELFLIAREELYNVEEAKKSKDGLAESVHAATYELLKATMALY